MNPSDMTALPDLAHGHGRSGPVRQRRPVYLDLLPPCNGLRLLILVEVAGSAEHAPADHAEQEHGRCRALRARDRHRSVP